MSLIRRFGTFFIFGCHQGDSCDALRDVEAECGGSFSKRGTRVELAVNQRIQVTFNFGLIRNIND